MEVGMVVAGNSKKIARIVGKNTVPNDYSYGEMENIAEQSTYNTVK